MEPIGYVFLVENVLVPFSVKGEIMLTLILLGFSCSALSICFLADLIGWKKTLQVLRPGSFFNGVFAILTAPIVGPVLMASMMLVAWDNILSISDLAEEIIKNQKK